jgi:hypothetical protein
LFLSHSLQVIDPLPWRILAEPDLHHFAQQIDGAEELATTAGAHIIFEVSPRLPDNREKEDFSILNIPVDPAVPASPFSRNLKEFALTAVLDPLEILNLAF